MKFINNRFDDEVKFASVDIFVSRRGTFDQRWFTELIGRKKLKELQSVLLLQNLILMNLKNA